MKYTVLITIMLALSGCSSGWQKVNCGWTDRVLPIEPSRVDKLSAGTINQILAANNAQLDNCR